MESDSSDSSDSSYGEESNENDAPDHDEDDKDNLSLGALKVKAPVVDPTTAAILEALPSTEGGIVLDTAVDLPAEPPVVDRGLGPGSTELTPEYLDFINRKMSEGMTYEQALAQLAIRLGKGQMVGQAAVTPTPPTAPVPSPAPPPMVAMDSLPLQAGLPASELPDWA